MEKELVSKSSGSEKREIRTSVEEIENGFLIIRREEWTDPETGWQSTEKKYYSDSNPLEDVEKNLVDNFKE